ncbi:MAG: MarR family transcriptional regulator [Devosia sp.]
MGTPSFANTVPLGYLIHEVMRLQKRRFEDEARIHGVTLPQWRALAETFKADGISQRALADRIDADPMTVSGILDRLEKRGLIARSPDPNDSRAKLARVTPLGEELIAEVRTVGLALHAQATEGISPEDQKIVTNALERMRENLIAMTAEQKEDAE